MVPGPVSVGTCLVVGEARDHEQVGLDLFQGRQRLGEFVVRSHLRRRPVFHDGAIGEEDEGCPVFHQLFGRRPRSTGDHRIQNRQSERCSGTFEDCAS